MMKLIIYKYYLLSFLVLCNATLFGAASSSTDYQGQQPAAPGHIPPLYELSMQAVIDEMLKEEAIPIASSSSQEAPPKSLFRRALRNLRKKLTRSKKTSALAPIESLVNIDSPERLNEIINSLGLSDDQLNIKVLSRKSTPDTNVYITLKEELLNRFASLIAKDHFLALAEQGKKLYPTLIPAWLQPHFTGVSIQNLLDYNIHNHPEFKFIQGTVLNLRLRQINDITGIKNIPGIQNVTNIHLSMNLIRTITSNDFEQLQRLQSISLNNNRITHIQTRAFAQLPALESIDLSENRITTMQPEALFDLPVLNTLNLDFNQLTRVNHTSFFNVPLVKILTMGENKISRINLHDFDSFPALTNIDLGSNQIAEVEPGSLSTMPHIKAIVLSDNPIAHNEHERMRIEDEIRAATDDNGQVIWGG